MGLKLYFLNPAVLESKASKTSLKKIVKRSYNRRKLMKSIMVFSASDSKSKNWLEMEIDTTYKKALKERSKPIEGIEVKLLEIEGKV